MMDKNVLVNLADLLSKPRQVFEMVYVELILMTQVHIQFVQ